MTLRRLNLVCLSFLMAIASCGDGPTETTLSGDGKTPGSPRGVIAIKKDFVGRFLNPDHVATNSFRLQEVAGAQLAMMVSIAGYYETSGSTSSYTGSELNALSLNLWIRYFEELASVVATTCATKSPQFKVQGRNTFELKASAFTVMQELCGNNVSEQSLKKFWRFVIGPDTFAESPKWFSFMKEQREAGLSGEDYLRLALYTLFMTPEYLLER